MKIGNIFFYYTIGNQILGEELPSIIVLLSAILSIGLLVTFYALRSVALYTMAKKAGKNKPWIAYIPFFWMYTACTLIDEYRFFGASYKKAGVWLAIVFTLGEALALAYSAIVYFPIIGYYLSGGSVYIGISQTVAQEMGLTSYWIQDVYLGANFGWGYSNPYAVYQGLIIFERTNVLSILEIANIFIVVNVYFALFRKYIPNHYVAMSLLSVLLNIFPPLVFSIRKKDPVDYNEYLRSRYRYTRYYGGSNPNDPNGYGGNGGYGGQGGNGNQRPTSGNDSPFEGFEDKPSDDEPFEEFNRKK